MTWFSEGTDVGIGASLAQSYPIPLSAFLSINHHQLSALNVWSALLITSPTLVVHLTIASESIGDLLGMRTDLYRKRVRSHRCILRALGTLILPLWLALGLTAWLSSRALCWWLGDLVGSFFSGALGFWNWHTAMIFASFFFLCLFSRRPQVLADFRAHGNGESSPLGRLRIPRTFTKCAWCVPVVVDALPANPEVV